MDHDKKLAFIHKMTKLGLDHVQHFDTGGAVNNAIGSNVNSDLLPPSSTEGSPGTQNPYVQSNATNPNTGVLGTIGAGLGLNDNFQSIQCKYHSRNKRRPIS